MSSKCLNLTLNTVNIFNLKVNDSQKLKETVWNKNNIIYILFLHKTIRKKNKTLEKRFYFEYDEGVSIVHFNRNGTLIARWSLA
ncbi:hypothetical protein BpHYR1_043049 [Brachionus plicatilis]|uniref:Uncharacterized protein n=1 Tax=Brachionus plicatilis TaxID=10195 RepID=A0A3M7QVK2_BRAPC|nr:hypothetical protein BpHYR1_043049 [Brachionus plicatilis]